MKFRYNKSLGIARSMIVYLIILFILLSVLVFSILYHQVLDTRTRSPNIFLISIDTLRPDHLGCYGYERDTSPAIDQFAKDAVLFKEAIVPNPLTTPTLASILSGLYPRTHKVFVLGTRLSDDVELISEILKRHNYLTCGIVGQYNCNRKFGFNQGFDFYDDEFIYIMDKTHKNVGGKFHPESEKRAEEIVEKSISWIKSVINTKKPLFVWMHFMDPHAAYDPPGKYADIFKGSPTIAAHSIYGRSIPPDLIHEQARVEGVTDFDYYLNRYDGEIRYLDYHINILLQFLKDNNIYNDSLIILTADHGEYMGESNPNLVYFTHGVSVYESEIRVPLLIKLPYNRYQGVEVRPHVSVIDIFPAITGIIGEDKIYSEGKDLKYLITQRPQGHNNINFIQVMEGKKIAVRMDNYKLVIQTNHDILQLAEMLKGNKRVEALFSLFDLANDPLERNDIFHENNDLAMGMTERLFDWLVNNDTAFEKGFNSSPVLDEETKRHLKSLGYINSRMKRHNKIP